jgi:hypothetical protein
MKLILRLVGYSEAIDDEKYFYQINYDECVFNFDILKTKFSNLNIISNEELDNCTVTCNSKNLKKETIIDDTDTIYRLFIFSGNLEIKNKLIEIFKNNGEKSLMNQQIITDDNLSSGDDNLSSGDDNLSLGDLDDNEPDKSSKDSAESEDSQNYDFSDIELKLEIFKDPDFISLIKIYKNKPEIFKDFYKYISTSYLVKLEVNEDIDYSSNLDTIKNMNLNFIDEDIINSLKITNNHINLALRQLIATKS